jgi:hypothetical protein
MQVIRTMLRTDDTGKPMSLPVLPPCSWIDTIFLILNEAPVIGLNEGYKARRKDRDESHIVSPLPDDEWEVPL